MKQAVLFLVSILGSTIAAMREFTNEEFALFPEQALIRAKNQISCGLTALTFTIPVATAQVFFSPNPYLLTATTCALLAETGYTVHAALKWYKLKRAFAQSPSLELPL